MGVSPCSPNPVTPGIVTFDPTAFKTQYPQFATVDSGILSGNFQLATLMLNNSCCSVVQDAPTRAVLLNLITAHITALLNGINGEPPQGVVGRINSASEGSVSVQAEMLTKTESAAYWQQTPWGVAYWQATLQYRMARYVPAACAEVGLGFTPWDGWPQ